MKEPTLTRIQLTEAVYKAVGLSRNDSAHLVDDVLNQISNALASGDTVKLSSFGTFQIRKKNERMGRNPKTGKDVPITSRNVITFRASHVLKDLINDSVKGSSNS